MSETSAGIAHGMAWPTVTRSSACSVRMRWAIDDEPVATTAAGPSCQSGEPRAGRPPRSWRRLKCSAHSCFPREERPCKIISKSSYRFSSRRATFETEVNGDGARPPVETIVRRSPRHALRCLRLPAAPGRASKANPIFRAFVRALVCFWRVLVESTPT